MWWKLALVALAVPIAGVGVLAVAGLFVARAHSARRSARYERSAEVVWSLISDLEHHASWRRGVRAMRRIEPRDGKPLWQEQRRRGDVMNMLLVELDPPRRMVTQVVDHRMFGGTWTWEIQPQGDEACTLTITENGEIYNPIFRAVARFVAGYHRTMDAVHASLRDRLLADAAAAADAGV